MSDPPPPTSLPPADWYPDPEAPGRLRYWDGEQWTEHRHSSADDRSKGSSGLVSLGAWFGQWTRALLDNFKPVLFLSAFPGALATITSLVGIVVLVTGFELTLSSDARGSHIESVIWPSPARSAVGGFLLVIGLVATVWFRAASAHLLYWIHRGITLTGRQSLTATASRFGRILGWYLVLALLSVLAIVLIGGVSAALALTVPFALLLVIPAAIGVGLWAFPRIALFEIALAVAPRHDPQSPLGIAHRLTRGRWAPILGRLLLAAVAASVVGWVVQTGASTIISQVVAQGIDSSQITIEDVPNGGGLIVLEKGSAVTSLSVPDLISMSNLLWLVLLGGALTGLSNALQSLAQTSATAHMYVDLDGPAAAEPTGMERVAKG